MPRVTTKEVESVSVKTKSQEHVTESTVIVEIPVSERLGTGFQIHVDAQLQGEAAMTLRRIAKAFDKQQAVLRNGRRVVDPTTAFRKLLEIIEDANNT